MNSENSILLIDPAFDTNTSVNCCLLLKTSIDSISYAILDKEANKIVAVFDQQECEDVSNTLSDHLKNDVYLRLTFNEIKLAIYTENNISIPNSLYNSDNPKLDSKFFTQPYSENLYTTTHPNFGFTSVFSFSKITDEIISQSFANSKKYQPNDMLLKLAENIPDTSLLLDFTAGSIHMLFLKNKQVVLQQCYETANAEEFNYYILLIINQLSINLNETPVYISGIIHDGDEKYNCLKQYLGAVQFLNFVDFNLDQQILENMPSHYYTSLLALDQCV